MKRFSFLRFFFISFYFMAYGPGLQASSGTEGASFLDIPVGAGPAALGGAYTARATDAYGLVWNPAALARVNAWEVTGQHLSYLESVHHEFSGLTIPLRPGSTLAGGIQYLGSGDIQGMDNNGSSTGDFSSHYAAYSMAFGQAFGDKFSLGVAGKWIEAKLSDVHANAYAADIGSYYKANDRLALAATLANIGSNLTFIHQGDPLPMALHAGFLYAPLSHWNVSVEGEYQKSGLASGHTGIEWQPISYVSLRAGYRTDTLKDLSALAGFSTGLGVHVWGQEFAYAWVPMGELGNTQYFSLLLKFGKQDDQGRNLVYLGEVHRHAAAWSPPATLREGPESRGDVEQAELLQLLSNGESKLVDNDDILGALAR